MRDSQEPRTEGSVKAGTRSNRRPAKRRLWGGMLALLLPLVLVLVASLAPTGQAHPARERTPEEEFAKAQVKLAEREQRESERQARQEANAQIRAQNTKWAARGNERENGVVQITCTQVSWTFRNFPDLPGNTVTEKLAIGHQPATLKSFTFDGSTGTDVIAINAPPGSEGHAYQIDAWGKWSTNGVRGAFDIHVKVKCAPAPALSIEKLQKIAGNGASYTSSPISGQPGQLIDYEILARNTGNVPLSLASFSDPRCDVGTITGGPGSEVLVPGASSTYLCTHLLVAADQTAGSYSNTVSIEASPPAGEGLPITETSNTVVAEVPPTPSTPEGGETPGSPPTVIQPSSSTPTASVPAPASSVLASTTTQTPRSGVLAFSSSTVPSLKGPQGCVRSRFRVSISSAGVASVIFYLDGGHKLRRMTAHSAKHGLLSFTIDPSRLSVGAHRLLARITMVKTPGSSKAVTASRHRTVLRCRSAALTPKFTG